MLKNIKKILIIVKNVNTYNKKLYIKSHGYYISYLFLKLK